MNYTKQTIALWYGVDPKTLARKLTEAGICEKGSKKALTPLQVKQVIFEFGIPEKGQLPKHVSIPFLKQMKKLESKRYSK